MKLKEAAETSETLVLFRFLSYMFGFGPVESLEGRENLAEEVGERCSTEDIGRMIT